MRATTVVNYASLIEKFVSGLFGAIRRLCRQEDKGGTEGEEDGGLELREPNKRRGVQDRWCLKLYTKATNQHQPGRRREINRGRGERTVHSQSRNTCRAGHQERDD